MIASVTRPVIDVINFLKFIFIGSVINFLSEVNRCDEIITPI